MSGEVIHSPDVVPPACRFFRETIADPDLTDHDINITSEHTRDCVSCKDTIGQMIYERIEENKRAEASGA